MTEQRYLENPNMSECQSIVLRASQDERGEYVVFRESIFYPQGGGQPADQGCFTWKNGQAKIKDVRNMEGEIRHYCVFDSDNPSEGQEVSMVLDADRRELNTRYHTAGHLIAAVVPKCFSQLIAVKGHQFPGEAYVKFDGTIVDDIATMQAQVQEAINVAVAKDHVVKTEAMNHEQAEALLKDLPYDLPVHKEHRVCTIDACGAAPCGGTHVSRLGEIGAIQVKQMKCKKGQTSVSYSII